MRWMPVPGFEKEYMISDTGAVHSIRRNLILKPKIDRYGYPAVLLTKPGVRKYTTVHRLVAETFIPNPLHKHTVNHKDENKLNNNASNLEWMTVRENCSYGTRTQRMAKSKCKRPVIGYMPDGSTANFDGVKQASRETGLAHSQITRCCKRLTPNTHGIVWRYADDASDMD